jgi:hypothetical protein
LKVRDIFILILLLERILIEECLDQIDLNEEMIERVESTKILHADDLTSNVLGELKVNCHFAAL